ncbi:MAG: transporter substrate-binding domain-containing protein, partial [Oscillospiraceae bacterium]|nr:transporter substrate-binding domain-containing protein [Oscillospiraceae bacterium]
MKKIKKVKKADIIIVIVLMLMTAGIVFMFVRGGSKSSDLSGSDSVSTASAQQGEPSYTEYNGKKIGIITGTSFEEPTFEYFPDSEYLYYNSYNDIAMALAQGSVDGFVGDEPALRMLSAENKNVDYLKKKIVNDTYAFGFTKGDPKTDKMREQMNEMIAEFNADGTMDELNDIWFGSDESRKVVDLSGLSGERLNVVTTSSDVPFSYIKDNKNVGFAIDLIARFCRKYGYEPHIEDVDFAARIPGLVTNKYDICASSLTVTEERKESIDFSDTMYEGGIVLAVRASDLKGSGGESYSTVEDRPLSYYAEKGKIGAITGGLYEVELNKRYPNAEILQYNAQPDLAIALSEGKIDAFTCPISSAKDFMSADSSLTYLNEVFMKIPYGFAFKKADGTNELRDQLNEYLAKIHSDGTYDEIVDIWFGDDESRKTVDYTGLDGNGTVLRYITASTMQPYSYIKDGQNAGLEADIIARFCREYGYGLKIDNADFAALIPGITSGTYDIASGTIMITEERAQSVDFSDVYYTTDAVAVVRKENISQTPAERKTEELSFFAGIKESFNKNFIREDRYKLILEGIGTTCIITALSVLFGSLLAFLICMFRRTDSVLADKISNIYVKLLQGTPMVVLLMILYY